MLGNGKHVNRITIAKMRMITYMDAKTRKDRTRNKDNREN